MVEVCYEVILRLRHTEKREKTMIKLRGIIHNAKLTKTQQTIAEFVLDHSADACFMTSTEIADRLEVSESSVIRFARSLGYT